MGDEHKLKEHHLLDLNLLRKQLHAPEDIESEQTFLEKKLEKRVREIYPKTMNILVTAYQCVVSKSITIGINGFIEKYLNIRTIEACLSQLMKKRYTLQRRIHEHVF